MNDVSIALIEARNLLLDPDNSKRISVDTFIDELVFSIYGFDLQPSPVFLSRSQRTQIELLHIKPDKIEIKFDAVQGFVGLTGSYESQRNAINKRINDAVIEIKKKYNIDVLRRYEKIADVYATRIEVLADCLTLAGVTLCREMIGSVVNCIES